MTTTASLTASQGDLIRETEPARLALLTEDELIELHQRVRRARNKHGEQPPARSRPAPVQVRDLVRWARVDLLGAPGQAAGHQDDGGTQAGRVLPVPGRSETGQQGRPLTERKALVRATLRAPARAQAR